MTKLNIDFKNCYGIKNLQHEFEFSDTHSTFSLYASNGSMKTSFAKTFEDISKGEQPKDLVYPDRKTICSIKLDNNDINTSQIFVIHSYKKDYESGKISTLMVNKNLRKEYESIHKEIDGKKENLLKQLKQISKLTKVDDIEKHISKTFYHRERNKFFEALIRIKDEVHSDEITIYKDIKHSDLFNDKVKVFLEQPDIKENIEQYISKYDELLDNSTYFKKGIFNHSQAEDTAKQLAKNGFFRAQHSVLFGEKKLSTETELTKVINQEKEAILSNPELQTAFNKIDKKISNADLKKFRDFLLNNPFIIAELNNLESFEAKLWKYYLSENKSELNDLLDKHSKAKEQIQKIVQKAKEEQTQWLDVVGIFNERFTVPFKVTISNKTEVILENNVPTVSFEFSEGEERKNIKREDLLNVLSQGEKRALYLLDIIFEIEARKSENQNHIFVIDDIADSFDYQNKYAIIEYLRDISKQENFYQIVLSHNFDFHRTVSSRLSMERGNKLEVIKTNDGIELKEETYQKNPFNNWRENLQDNSKLIASIPFVRNLAEYSGDTELANKLTSFVHIKDDTRALTIGNLKTLFEKFLNGNLNIRNADKNFIELLDEVADGIINKNFSELEHKIVLAISIRLNAEQFMIDQINDADFLNTIDKHQTAQLLDKYKSDFDEEKQNTKILDKVQLMTPESIHLNSFMYEPLLDMSGEYLVRLHGEVKGMG